MHSCISLSIINATFLTLVPLEDTLVVFMIKLHAYLRGEYARIYSNKYKEDFMYEVILYDKYEYLHDQYQVGTSVEFDDLEKAMAWAKVAIEQGKTAVICNIDD